jgi:hypothetical protein
VATGARTAKLFRPNLWGELGEMKIVADGRQQEGLLQAGVGRETAKTEADLLWIGCTSS